MATGHLEWCLAVAAVLLLAGCSSSGAAGSSGGDAGKSPVTAKPLTYYLDQTATLAGDRNIELQQYKAALSLCEQSGLSVTPLDPTDVAKLRMTRIQIWKTPGRMAKQEDGWRPMTAPGSMLQGGACQFTGVKKISTLTITLPGRVYSIDLVKRTGTVEHAQQSNSPDVVQAVTPAEESAMEKKAIYDGVVKGKRSRVAGQPCVLWSYNKIQGQGWQACTWSAGKQWGVPAVGRTFPLSAKSMDGKYSMTTTTMTVGHLPGDGDVFEIPVDVKIRDQGDTLGEGVSP